MKIKYSILIALLLSAISLHAHAQQNGGGLLYANTFAQWTIPQGNNGAFSWTPGSACSVNSQGSNFVAFKVGTPVKLQDIQNPALDETITPNAVNISASNCTISARTVNQHYSFNLSSATFGLQEAINYAISQGQTYVVVLTPAWANMGGTTDMITAALGSVNVSILDQRTSFCTSYEWNGSAYAGRPCGGGGSPDGPHTIQGADPVGTSFVSTGELIGNTYTTPEAAVADACASGLAVYFPAGTYTVSSTMNLCTGLHIRCASSDVIAAHGTIFQLSPGAAIWAVANPNADASGSPATNEVRNVVIDNCTFDLSNDPQALGSVRLKGIENSHLHNVVVYGNDNPNPLFTEDGSNFLSNGGDYNNDINNLTLYDKSSHATQSTCMYITGDNNSGSNDNHHFGGSWQRCATALKIDAGNNNTFYGIDGEGWTHYGVYYGTNGTKSALGNRLSGFRLESTALTSANSWQANTAYTTSWPNNVIIDPDGFAEVIVTAGTSGATIPNFSATALLGTTTDGTAVWQKQYNGIGVFAESGTEANVTDVYQSGLYQFTQDLSGGKNIYSCTDNIYGTPQNPVNFCNITSNFNDATLFVNADPSVQTNHKPWLDGGSGGGISVHGKFQLDSNLLISNNAGNWTSIVNQAQHPNEHINIPDLGGSNTFSNFLVTGVPLTVTPTQAATVPGTNYSSLQLFWQNSWYTGQIQSGSYLSGITAIGIAGQTCTLSGFNNGLTGATATVTLTDTNTIAIGTPLVITAAGSGGDSTNPPTSALASNGTATCSGTATLSGVSIGAAMGLFNAFNSVGTGSNPNQNLIFNCLGTTGICSYFFETGNGNPVGSFNIFNPTPATSSNNWAAPKLALIGDDWTGSASATSNWNFTPSVGSGANPANTLTIGYSGPGTGTLALPANTTVGGGQIQPVFSGQFTTTTTTSESVTLNGCTVSSHAWVQAVNSTAASMTGVFVTSPVANGFTLNHSATAGGIFNTFCTAN